MGTQNQEDLQKQQQMMQQQQEMMRKQYILNWIGNSIRNLNKKDVLDALSKNVGTNYNCPNPIIANQLNQKIATLLLDTPELDDHVVTIQSVLLSAISLTQQIRMTQMYAQVGQNNMNPMMGMNMMNPMMGGMSMGMPGMMNPMMGGFGMMNPMMGGYNMMGMNPMQNKTAGSEEDESKRKIQIAKDYIKTNIYQADPLVLLSMISNRIGISIDFSSDPQFEDLITQALNAAIYYMAFTNPMIFQTVYCIIYNLYTTDYYSKLSNGKQQNNQQNQNNMMGGFGMMNPMMGMNMMNPMMGGMSMGMPGMMNGMMPSMDQSMGMGMGFGMMNPMGMGPMMGGMNMMPGMTGTMPGVGGSIY